MQRGKPKHGVPVTKGHCSIAGVPHTLPVERHGAAFVSWSGTPGETQQNLDRSASQIEALYGAPGVDAQGMQTAHTDSPQPLRLAGGGPMNKPKKCKVDTVGSKGADQKQSIPSPSSTPQASAPRRPLARTHLQAVPAKRKWVSDFQPDDQVAHPLSGQPHADLIKAGAWSASQFLRPVTSAHPIELLTGGPVAVPSTGKLRLPGVYPQWPNLWPYCQDTAHRVAPPELPLFPVHAGDDDPAIHDDSQRQPTGQAATVYNGRQGYDASRPLGQPARGAKAVMPLTYVRGPLRGTAVVTGLQVGDTEEGDISLAIGTEEGPRQLMQPMPRASLDELTKLPTNFEAQVKEEGRSVPLEVLPEPREEPSVERIGYCIRKVLVQAFGQDYYESTRLRVLEQNDIIIQQREELEHLLQVQRHFKTLAQCGPPEPSNPPHLWGGKQSEEQIQADHMGSNEDKVEPDTSSSECMGEVPRTTNGTSRHAGSLHRCVGDLHAAVVDGELRSSVASSLFHEVHYPPDRQGRQVRTSLQSRPSRVAPRRNAARRGSGDPPFTGSKETRPKV